MGMTPIGLGLLVGARCLGGLLMGSIASGFLLAVMMNNAGGAWDNSKKWVENEQPPIGPGGAKVTKGTDHHAAVVVGDTVGDPFKDTSGPALNILIRLMANLKSSLKLMLAQPQLCTLITPPVLPQMAKQLKRTLQLKPKLKLKRRLQRPLARFRSSSL